MSGFELDLVRSQTQQTLSEGAGDVSRQAEGSELLKQLRQSSDIARDLAALYSDRPYAYARVMQQLGGVLGGAKVRRLHSEVIGRAKERSIDSAKKGVLRSTRNVAAPSQAPANTNTASGGETEAAEKTFNISLFGVSKEVKVSSGGGKHSFECSDWNIPCLKNLKGSAEVEGGDVKRVELGAKLNAEHLEEADVTVRLDKQPRGGFAPSAAFSAKFDIPGIKDFSANFEISQRAESTSLTGRLSSAVILGSLNAAVSGEVRITDTTHVSGQMSVSNGAGAGRGSAQAGAQSTGGLSVSGNVSLEINGKDLTGIAGDLNVGGFGLLANPDDKVVLNVGYAEAEGFSASLGGPVRFVRQDDKHGVEYALTVDSASYTEETQFSANATLGVKIGDMFEGTGNVVFENNTFETVILDMTANDFALPKSNAIVSGSLQGTAEFTKEGFAGADIAGDLIVSLGGVTADLNLAQLNVSAEGVVDGEVLLNEPCTLGFVTINTLQVLFDTLDGIQALDGKVVLDHPNIKSVDELVIAYHEEVLTAEGAVALCRTGGDEIATSAFSIQMSSDTLNAQGKFELSADLGLPSAESKFKLKEGTTADVIVVDGELQTITVNGEYSYGVSAEGGEQEAGAGGVVFDGELKGCTIDLEEGTFSGTVDVNLLSDIVLGKGKNKVTIFSKRRAHETALSITFENSQPTRFSGVAIGMASVVVGKDTLELQTTVDNFDYDVVENSFTGEVRTKLNSDFDVLKEPTAELVLKGNQVCGVNLWFVDNEITKMDIDAVAKLKLINNAFKKGSGKFECGFNDASIDLETGAISTPNVFIKTAEETVLLAHDKKTEVTLTKGDGAKASIVDGQVSTLDVKFGYTGETTALGSTEKLVFAGSINAEMSRLDSEEPSIDGSLVFEVTKDCLLDEIEGEDKIWLLEGANLNVKVSAEGLEKISGGFAVRYEREAGGILEKKLSVKLSSDDLVYDVPKGDLSGNVKLVSESAIVLKFGDEDSGAVGVTVPEGAEFGAEISNSQLTKLTGDIDPVDIVLKNAVFEGGEASLQCGFTGAVVDFVGEDGITCPNVYVKAAEDMTLVTHKEDTKLTIEAGSTIVLSVENSLVKTLNAEIAYNGETKVLGTEQPMVFKGTGNASMTGLDGPDADIKGNFAIEVTKDCLLDSIQDVDEIWLLEGAHIETEFSEKGINEVSGGIAIRYKHGAVGVLTDGLDVTLSGDELVYNVGAQKFSGDISLVPNKAIKFAFVGETTIIDVTVETDGTTFDAKIKDNELTYLGGSIPTVNVEIRNDVFEEKVGHFQCGFNDASVDLQGQGGVDCPDVYVKAAEDVVFVTHDRETFVTLKKDSGGKLEVANSQVKKLEGDLKYTGRTTALKTEEELTFEGSGRVMATGLDAGEADVSGDLNIKVSHDCLLKKLSGGAEISLLEDTRVETRFTKEGIGVVQGGVGVRYALKAGGFKGLTSDLSVKLSGSDLAYDVPAGEFSGEVDLVPEAAIALEFGQEGGTKVAITVPSEKAGFKAIIASNELTYLGGSIEDVAVDIHNKVFKDDVGKFICGFKDAEMNLQTGKISCPVVSVEAAENVTLEAHGGDTSLTLTKGGGAQLSVVENAVSTLNGQIEYTGSTKALKTVEPVEVAGSMNVEMTGLDSDVAEIEGKFNVGLTSSCELADVADVKITLLEGTNVEVEFSNEGIEEVNGKIDILFAKGPSKALPKGINVKLLGDNLNYKVEERLFSGDVSLETVDPIELTFGGDDLGVDFTLEKGDLRATVEENQLTSLGGSAEFSAVAKLGDAGNIEINQGQAQLECNVSDSSPSLSKLDVTCTVEPDLTFGPARLHGGCGVECSFDSEGLNTAKFEAGLNLDVQVNNNLVELTATGEVSYKRESGIDGEITVACAEQSKLGDIKRNEMTYDYGLGNGEGDALSVTLELKDSAMKRVHGKGGLYLEQQAGSGDGDDLLKIQGNIEFDYDAVGNVLTKAEGEVNIARKNLATIGGETLVLGESTAKLTVLNNELQSLSGVVTLLLNDGDDDYLSFMTTGEFDCLDGKTFTGEVSAKLLRDKRIGDGMQTNLGMVQFYLAKEGDGGQTGFDIKITENKIDAIKGAINFLMKRDNEDFFSGAVEGTYLAASAEGSGGEAQLDAKGSIKLLSDIDFPLGATAPIFTLLGGKTGGEVVVTKNEIDTIKGEVGVRLKAPTVGDGGEEQFIEVAASGTIDVKEGKVVEATGSVSCDSLRIMDGLAITGLSAEVTVRDNNVEEIRGSAGVKYEKNGFCVEGGCEEFVWKKREDGTDGIRFVGNLEVTAFEGKLRGKVDVEYDTLENPDAAPKIKGELEFQITEWLGGMVGIEFGEEGWADPILSGRIDVTNAQLLAGRQLLGFAKDLGISIPVFPGVNIGAGIGIGLSVDLLPLMFNASVGIERYRIREGGMPNFDASMEISSGLGLSASISPYAQISVGVPNVIEGGVRIRGVAKLSCNAGLSLGGSLKGGKDGLTGDLGLGLDISGQLTLSVVPELFATLLGKGFNYQITTWDFDLGELFKFSWGKGIKFDEAGNTTLTDGGGNAEPLQPTSTPQNVEATQGMEQEHAPTETGGKKEGDAFELPGSKDVADDAGGNEVTEEKAGGVGDKMQQAADIAKAIGAISNAIGLIAGIVTSAVIGGPIGPIVFLAIKIIKGELSLSIIKQMITDIKDGIAALKQLLADNEEAIRGFLPDWLNGIIDFFQQVAQDGLVKVIVDLIDEKINGLGSPMREILQPLVDFARRQEAKIAEIAELFASGGAGNIIQGVFRILGFAFSAVIDMINMFKEMWNIFQGVVATCVRSGSIYVKYKSNLIFDEYFWQFAIPGLCSFSGSGKLLARGAAELMLLFFKGAGLQKERIN